MRTSIVPSMLLAAISLALPALGQNFEVGAGVGGGFYIDKGVAGPRGSGNAGFSPGMAITAWVGHNSPGKLGGEFRYILQRNDMTVTSGGNSYAFAGRSHAIHYDVVIHATGIEDNVRPYVSFGGGIKGYQGTGTERAFQPLSNIAILTKTQQWQPLITFGAGVKWSIGSRVMLRAEVRDYLTRVPTDVILPAPGAKLGGWLHDLTPTIGISYLFQ
jgi:hypothetical protein